MLRGLALPLFATVLSPPGWKEQEPGLLSLGVPHLVVVAVTQGAVTFFPFLAEKREQCYIHLEREAAD